MKLFELQTDFFRPLWRRVAVLLVCVAWAGVEFSNDAPFWGMIFLGLGFYAAYQFFLDNWP